jgi:hypothetical protein
MFSNSNAIYNFKNFDQPQMPAIEPRQGSISQATVSPGVENTTGPGLGTLHSQFVNMYVQVCKVLHRIELQSLEITQFPFPLQDFALLSKWPFADGSFEITVARFFATF